MKLQGLVLVVLGLLVSVAAFSQSDGQMRQEPRGSRKYVSTTGMHLPDMSAPDIPGVVAGGSRVELVKDDYNGAPMISYEGPVPMPDGSILFAENVARRIHRIDNEGQASVFMQDTNTALGLAFDSKGRLIAVETTPGKSRIAVIYPKGSETVLSDNYDGKPYGRPNDLVVDKKGGVYFTDPGPRLGPGETLPLPMAVYYISPGGKTIQVIEDINRPNGIQLSPSEDVLYVNSESDYLLAFDIQPDGALRNRRNFAKYSQEAGPRVTADGLAVDSAGRVYVASRAGVQVFSPKGEHLGTIPTARQPQNLAFGGPDKKTLYVVGFNAVWKIPMLSQGIKTRAK